MKSCKTFLLILTTIMLFSGCGGVQMLSDTEADVYAKIHRRYSEMKSYSATAEITFKSNKTENKYTVLQKYCAPNKMAAEITETNTSYVVNDGKAAIKKGENSLNFQSAEDINYLFLNDFFKMYYMSQNTALTASTEAAGGVIRLETELVPVSALRCSAELTLNVKTLAPERLTVKDAGKNAVIIIDFKDFLYNAEIDEEVFSFD